MSEAQRLADELEDSATFEMELSFLPAELRSAAAELRRLEAENARMRSELERPMSSEATVLVHDNARLRAEVQRLETELSMATVLHARLTHEAIKAQARCIELEAEVQALRGAVPAAIEVTADNDAAYGYQDGWNDCRKAMIAAAPQPAAQQEPAGEPYAWHYRNTGGASVWHLQPSKRLEADMQAAKDFPKAHFITALYTRPAVPRTREAIQQAFEAWIKTDSTLPVTKQRHGYTNFTVALQWHAWQAARKIGGAE